ncbi:LysR family transcriptional regulator [Burkholderia sp. 22PA0099]|uniref:LysR family transcriptional regulator n=1 Tax=Burkholderia sp. 22PA0099 TaxID=3237372 RepID=UPI0039C0F23B
MLRAGLSELTAFVAIAEQRSFRAAALSLAVSPSALSHSMRSLEARLGVRLFNRTTRSVALTEAGEQLLRRVGPALSDLENAVDEVATAQNRPAGSVRISASESSTRLLIRHVLPGFLLRYPDIHVEFVTDTRLIDIVGEGFDAGIRVLDDVPRDMIAVRFGPEMRFIAVASPAYLARHPAPERPADLMQHRCIRFRFESGAMYRWDFQSNGKTSSLDVGGPMTLGNINSMIETALAGIGVAWVPENQVAEYLADGQLVALLREWSVAMPGLALYYPANRHPPAPLRLFVQAVRDWVSGDAPEKV